MSKVYYYEGVTTMGEILTMLKGRIMTPYALPEINNWTVAHEDGETLVMKIKTVDNKEAFIQFKRSENSALGGRECTLKISYGESWDEATKKLTPNPSPESVFSLGKDSIYSIVIPRTETMEVAYWLSMNNNYIAFAYQGDPSLDFLAYNQSFLYFGRIVPFSPTDIDGNIAFTCGVNIGSQPGQMSNSYLQLNPATDIMPYGRYTSKAMADISMLKTKSKLHFQKHFPATLNASGIIEQISAIDNKFFLQASAWSKKYHASPVYVVHPYDGYRGYMEGIIAIHPESLIENDILQENVGTEEVPEYQQYKVLDIHKNGGTNFINQNANNPNLLLAIRKS